MDAVELFDRASLRECESNEEFVRLVDGVKTADDMAAGLLVECRGHSAQALHESIADVQKAITRAKLPLGCTAARPRKVGVAWGVRGVRGQGWEWYGQLAGEVGTRCCQCKRSGWSVANSDLCWEDVRARRDEPVPLCFGASQIEEYVFTENPAEYKVYWDVRKGLIPIVGGGRETGEGLGHCRVAAMVNGGMEAMPSL